MTLACPAYCPHGGICILDDKHDGLHTSGRCTWDSAESIDEATADAMILKIDPQRAAVAIGLREMFDPRKRGE